MTDPARIRLQQQAITAAKNGDWEQAISCNQELVNLDIEDVGAYNRLGIAYLQQKREKEAKIIFKKVLEIDKNNVIAHKNLTRIAAQIAAPQFAQSFIEEPGKTRSTALHRVASKDRLSKLSVGDSCQLKPKNRYISVEVNNEYVGALAEDLSFRLSKLIEGGNQYECLIRSVDPSSCSCSVFLRETFKHPKHEHMTSFPVSTSAATEVMTNDQTYEAEHIPLNLVSTDEDDEDKPDAALLSDDEETEDR